MVKKKSEVQEVKKNIRCLNIRNLNILKTNILFPMGGKSRRVLRGGVVYDEQRNRNSVNKSLALDLPDHVLELVVEHLCLPDLFRFGWVCKLWKSVCDPLQFQNHLPWLIGPFNNNKDDDDSSLAFDSTETAIGFFSLRNQRIYKAELPELSNRRICGSLPAGWLMTIHENSEIQLFNPFIMNRLSQTWSSASLIYLPPMSKLPGVTTELTENELFYVGTSIRVPAAHFRFPSKEMRDVCIDNVAMSSSLITKGTVIMVIQGVDCALAFYIIGGVEQVWTPVSRELGNSLFHDLTYYKGKFFAVHNNGYVVVIDGVKENSLFSPSLKIVVGRHPFKFADHHYILESSGDLLVVLRYLKALDDSKTWRLYRTVGFKVLKLDFTGRDISWVEVESIGDRSLFLGGNTSFTIQANEFSGCKPNCIYFTDNFYNYNREFGGHDLGVFSLQDGSIENFHYQSDDVVVMPPPVWYAPNLSC
ncbi:F-box protein skip23 [Thalictrum thalictroides]|uniref:F-box protein skip23 n=1 Tax=Thalictrum thalictroides TaxID=46969 RepID=A0A7J6W335_THATH|nr:F-box protein skip23 [Thalictrum thalictroides]